MKMNSNISGVHKKIISFFAIFMIMAVLFGWLYKIGVNRPPLRYANVPQNTKDFINNLGKKGDQGLSYKDQGPFDWDDDKNLGEQDWSKEYDANFIVYYHKDSEAKWQLYAQQVLEAANENISGLIDLMGKYYYAEDMNGRKLAIYLPETEDLYKNTISTLMEGRSNGAGSLGITITQVGPFGCLTKGIVLNPMCFEGEPNGINGYLKTLKHEMNHYVFFSSLDYSKEIKHYLWLSEGVAEYYCNRHEGHQVASSDSIRFIEQNCQLNGEFPLDQNSAYWAGESFYRYLEQAKGKPFVQKFISKAYEYSTDSTFITNKLSQKKEKQQWVGSLNIAKSNAVLPDTVDVD